MARAAARPDLAQQHSTPRLVRGGGPRNTCPADQLNNINPIPETAAMT